MTYLLLLFLMSWVVDPAIQLQCHAYTQAKAMHLRGCVNTPILGLSKGLSKHIPLTYLLGIYLVLAPNNRDPIN